VGALLHWNGHVWAKIGGKLPKGQLAGPIAPDGSDGLWLIGRTPAFSQFILHYAGGRWTRFKMPTDSVGTVQINALRLIPGTKTVLGAVGAHAAAVDLAGPELHQLLGRCREV
jgi:hypothetical protein